MGVEVKIAQLLKVTGNGVMFHVLNNGNLYVKNVCENFENRTPSNSIVYLYIGLYELQKNTDEAVR